MRVLITGVTGFVGGYLAAEIARAHPDAEIWGAGHAPPLDAPRHSTLPATVQILNGDLTDRAFLTQVIDTARPDQVYHLAGFASGAGGDRARIFQVNVEATLDLLRGLTDAGRSCRVQLASSGYVYGATPPGHPARETDALAPHGEYAESKAAMETAVEVISA